MIRMDYYYKHRAAGYLVLVLWVGNSIHWDTYEPIPQVQIMDPVTNYTRFETQEDFVNTYTEYNP